MIIILFGAPGVGKTTIAQELESFGYHHYEGDDDLLTEVKELNRNNQFLPETLREKQNKLVIERIVQLSRIYSKLVVSYHFMWDRHRQRLLKLCPQARWFLITLDQRQLEKRVVRKDHLLSPKFALNIARAFEVPTIPYVEISNNNALENTIRQIVTIFDEPTV
jgi:broad-specificity NMP kinase